MPEPKEPEYKGRHRVPEKQKTITVVQKVGASKATKFFVVPLMTAFVAVFGIGSIAYAKPVHVAAGDTFSQLVRTNCHTGDWQGVSFPSRNKNLIYAGETININCPGKTSAAKPVAKPATPKAKKTSSPVAKTSYKGWVTPLPGSWLSSCYGPRWGTIHQGIDMVSGYGAHIRAASAGVVKQVGWIGHGYGREVMIYHGHGVWTHYAHTSAVVVRVGQTVAAGQYIAREGATGDVTGPHLHFEVETGNYGKTFIYGNQQNPAPVLRAHGVKIGC